MYLWFLFEKCVEIAVEHRWWAHFEGGKRDQVYFSLVYLDDLFHYEPFIFMSHITAHKCVYMFRVERERASCIVQICTETIHVMSVRKSNLIRCHRWCWFTFDAIIIISSMSYFLFSFPVSVYFYFLCFICSLLVSFFVSLTESNSIRIWIIYNSLTNEISTIRFDCSFMSRSMWYVTKRSYLTFTEWKIRFSLIFTCQCPIQC